MVNVSIHLKQGTNFQAKLVFNSWGKVAREMYISVEEVWNPLEVWLSRLKVRISEKSPSDGAAIMSKSVKSLASSLCPFGKGKSYRGPICNVPGMSMIVFGMDEFDAPYVSGVARLLLVLATSCV